MIAALLVIALLRSTKSALVCGKYGDLLDSQQSVTEQCTNETGDFASCQTGISVCEASGVLINGTSFANPVTRSFDCETDICPPDLTAADPPVECTCPNVFLCAVQATDGTTSRERVFECIDDSAVVEIPEPSNDYTWVFVLVWASTVALLLGCCACLVKLNYRGAKRTE